MITQIVPRLNALEIWRNAARSLLARNIPPEQISWADSNLQAALFAEADVPLYKNTEASKVPKEFLEIASKVVAHNSSDRFDRLYRVLWRLRSESNFLNNPADPDVHHLQIMVKSIRRDCHKMKAFVRFREILGEGSRRQFAAWFEPEHYIVELTGPFFANRFADMDWVISTPFGISKFVSGVLSYHEADGDRHATTDQTEDLWRTYYSNIFNPARLKVKAMQSEMPKKYWKNLPEAALIPELIAGAERRVQNMRERMPTVASHHLQKIKAPHAQEPIPEHQALRSIAELQRAAKHCQRCELHCFATQTVFGEGNDTAEIMFVGEQPGDQEDIAGQPFVGPAGQIFAEALRAANITRAEVYVTNAVKHFKFSPRGKRRLHERPNQLEILACKWWLDREIAIIKPKLLVAMGSTALFAITGNGKDITKRRGKFEKTHHGLDIFITNHPSAILRNHAEAGNIRRDFFADIAGVERHMQKL
jgi:uracil-DNA glycosylase